MSTAPVIDLDLQSLFADPYPALAKMRRETPIAFVRQLDCTLVTRRADILTCLEKPDVFSSFQSGSHMLRLMGHTMLEKDGAQHAAERKPILAAIGASSIRQRWLAEFQAHADRLLDERAQTGAMDLSADFALPFTARCLKSMLGLPDVDAQAINRWSRAMLEGISSFMPDPEKDERALAATAAIDTAIDAMAPVLRRSPDGSLLSAMLAAGLPMEQVRASIKLAISGGQNEPRDVITGTTWALLSHPDQLERVRTGQASWAQAAEEYMRWITPVGLRMRRVTQATSLGGIAFAPEDVVFLMLRSADRDEAHHERPDVFDVTRNGARSLAFSAGPHFCAGAWAARAMIADVALPTLFQRLGTLRLASEDPVVFSGFVFRGTHALPARWDTEAGRPTSH